jgi:hypothetical protein
MKKVFVSKKLVIVCVCINTFIFLLLSIMHFYWALGGRLWYEDVLPTNSNGLNRMNPGRTGTLFVAFGLLFFALLTLAGIGLFGKYIQKRYVRFGTILIMFIFMLRAMGDFRLVGFFKTVKTTRFAINDSQFFSPLCLFIALLSLLIFMYGDKLSSRVG